LPKRQREPARSEPHRKRKQRRAKADVQSANKQVRVLVADDHAVFREGLRALLNNTRDIKVVGEVARADDLKTALSENPCDVLLLDLRMDRVVTMEIEALAKTVKVVVLTGSERDEDVVTSLRLGARAVVHKTSAAEEIVDAIRAVTEGRIWIPDESRERFAARLQLSGAKVLTSREREVARLVASGLRNSEIARELGIANGTVKIHINSIFKKLNTRDRVELSLYAIEAGLITVSEARSVRKT
jgi:DNA-binding NarL/FixJ family response regulator